jgi:hypothetical protein
MSEKAKIHRGGCLCGAVSYEVTGPLRPVIACHCEQCRRTSGHYVSATAAARRDVVIRGEGALKWYQSSATARRGFCGACGSNLFFDREGRETIAIMAGTLDTPTGLRTVNQIFAEEAGDYYNLPHGVPVHDSHDPAVFDRSDF